MRLARALLIVFIAAGSTPPPSAAQGLTGVVFGTVRDAQGGVLPGALVKVTSPARIGGPATMTTNEKGQFWFPALPPGLYALEVTLPGFAAVDDEDIRIGTGETLERNVVLPLAGREETVVVKGNASLIDARDPGFATRFRLEDLQNMPTRRASMFDAIRAAPGVSPTSPSSGTLTTVSAFGSATNENQFLFDGTNFTCPCTGVARAEPGIDFIQEVQLQSVGASAEYGNVQGAVINVVTKQGGNRFLYDASYFGQMDGLTSQPVLLSSAVTPGRAPTGYERAHYHDVTTNFGGPVVRDRVWFFAGYQHTRDEDSQPGTDPAFPSGSRQENVFGKLTWQLTPRWQLVQSFHDQFWVAPDHPTIVTPLEATSTTRGTVPAFTLGNLTFVASPNTLWDFRVGRFVYAQESKPSVGDGTTPSRFDRATGVTSGGPPILSRLNIARTTAKAMITHYRGGLLGADHAWKAGGQLERGEHHATGIIPGGVRFVDNNGQPFQSISSDPANTGGQFLAAAAFVTDGFTVGDRLTINAGVRFDHTRAISQDLHRIDGQGQETGDIIQGLGTLYTWNILSPRLGLTARLGADGRTILRASYGRFSPGVLTGELGFVHPGATPITTAVFDPVTGGYRPIVTVNPLINVKVDPETRAPHTDEYSIGIDREIARAAVVTVAYVRKNGSQFTGWTDVGGQYVQEVRTLPDGRTLPVFVLANAPADRRFLLTNPDGYSLTYDGLVMTVETRRSHGWHASGSYTLSRSTGLLPSSGGTAGAPQSSTVAPNSTYGRDPNDLTNAHGLLLNDRPHMFRLITALDLPRAFVVAATMQYFTGKPWAATTQVSLPQGDQRILLETRGTRRLSSQSLLDLRVSKTIRMSGAGQVELSFDVLNALNSTAEAGLATDNLYSANFAQPTVFVDPRRAMIGVRLNLGR